MTTRERVHEAIENAKATHSHKGLTVKDIAEHAKVSERVARRWALALVEEGLVTGEKVHRWEKQGGNYAHAFFGGAGVVIRRFWVFAIKEGEAS